jgi:hypothetical protein
MTNTSSVQHLVEHEFIERLMTEVRAGFGLTPFLGSGCSADSGIMMGEQFSDYLGWTVYRCVADSKQGAHDDAKEPIGRWDLRKDGWPAEPNEEQVRWAREWALGEFRHLAKDCGLDVDDNPATHRIRGLAPGAATPNTPDAIAALLYAPLVPPFLRDPCSRGGGLTDGSGLKKLLSILSEKGKMEGGLLRPGISPTSEDAIFERAIRSLYDWRSTLRFLSELRLIERGRLALVEADPSVVDGFNVHITRNRRPNLLHTMLTHLREPARMRLFFTTNFDTLIEDAFAQQKRRIDVISVSVRGELPDPEIVHARDTILKLHGTLTETRADFSLDASPSLQDLRRFFHYVRGRHPEDDQSHGDRSEGGFVPSHLLVAGYSGSDPRCIQLVKFVLDGDPQAILFWVCNNEHDLARLCERFPERAYKKKIVATTAERFDLLLYEFHQRLCLSLPAGGATLPGSYQIKHSAPPQKSFRPRAHQPAEHAEATARIIDAVTWLEKGRDVASVPETGVHGKLVFIDGPSGVSQPMGSAFSELSRRYALKSTWLELEDFPNTGAVAHQLFQAIALRRGISQLRHAQLCPNEAYERCSPEVLFKTWREHIARLKQHLDIDPTRWLLAFYGRNGPGGCTGWEENRFWGDGPTEGPGEYGTPASPGTFTIFLLALVEAGFTVLYAPYSRLRREDDVSRRDELEGVLEDWDGLARLTSSHGKAAKQARIGEVLSAQWRQPFSTHDFKDVKAWLEGPDCHLPGGATMAVGIDLTPDLRPLQWGDEHFRRTMTELLHNGLNTDQKQRDPSDPEYDLSNPRGRYNLIYGASLFRQSRHYTAFLIEGLLRCPARFNPNGSDNDLLRYRRLEEVLELFNGHPRIFYRKPGGFAWTYRDVRLGMRCLAEVASRAAHDEDMQGLEATPSPAERAKARLLPSAELRARQHFWIGQWYMRAYYVSGDAGPLLEAAYHFSQCIWHSRVASAPGYSDGEARRRYQLHWWLLGINQLTKTLRVGGAAARFWLGRNDARHWFNGETRKFLKERTLCAYQGVKPPDPRLGATYVRLIRNLLAEFDQYVNWVSGCSWTQRESWMIAGRSPVSKGVGMLEPEPSPVEGFSRINLATSEKDWWRAVAFDKCPIGELMEVTEPLVSDGNNDAPRRQQITDLELGDTDFQFTARPGESARRLQRFVEWTFVLLSRAKRQECASWPVFFEQGPGRGRVELPVICVPSSVRWQWVRVCMFAQAAEDAWHWLPAGPDGFGAIQASKAAAMYGVALARLSRFQEAHRRFNQSHALLTEFSPNAVADLGILELRRAEAYLLEANLANELVEVFAGAANRDEIVKRLGEPMKEGEGFPELRERLSPALQPDRCVGSTDGDYLAEKRARGIFGWLHSRAASALQGSALHGSSVCDWRTIESHLMRLGVAWCDDAWGCLERAEVFLGGHTHSPLWWSRLRAMQLHAFATTTGNAGDGKNRYRSLTHRVRHDMPFNLRFLWQEGVSAAPGDSYNRLRMLDYYTRALTANGISRVPERHQVTAELDSIWGMLVAEQEQRSTALSVAYLRNIALSNPGLLADRYHR